VGLDLRVGGYSDINEDPSIGWTPRGARREVRGPAVSLDHGCSWSTKIADNVVDLVVLPRRFWHCQDRHFRAGFGAATASKVVRGPLVAPCSTRPSWYDFCLCHAMTAAEALELIRQCLEDVTEDASWRRVAIDVHDEIRDRGIDSVRSLELAGALEDRIGRQLTDNELERIRTFADLIAWICTHSGHQPGAENRHPSHEEA
jgi:acyl carrier protein